MTANQQPITTNQKLTTDDWQLATNNQSPPTGN
jgi:hypothetical protein